MRSLYGFRPTKQIDRVISENMRGTGLTRSEFMRQSLIEGGPIVKARFIREKKTTNKSV